MTDSKPRRRDLAALLLAASASIPATAQTPPGPAAPESRATDTQKALAALAKVELPMNTEPDFAYKVN